jgi:hypothetical protein
VLSTIVTDTASYGQILLLKVNVLPCQSAGFSDTKTSIVGYLDWQYSRRILFFEIRNQPLVILMR